MQDQGPNPFLPDALRALMPMVANLGTVNSESGMAAYGALLKATPTSATWTCPDCGEPVKPKEIGTRFLPAGHCNCPGGLNRIAASRVRWAENDRRQSEAQEREQLAARLDLEPGKSLESWVIDTAPRRKAREAAQGLVRRLDNGQWMIWWGPHGCGKTHLAYAVARELVIKHGTTVRVVNWLARLREIQMHWSQHGAINANSEEKLWQSMLKPQVLFLDDFDKGLPRPEDLERNTKLPSNWLTESLYFIVDERYRHGYATVLISNQSFADLTTVLQALPGNAADAVLSRFSRQGALSVDWGKLGLTEYAVPVDVPMF